MVVLCFLRSHQAARNHHYFGSPKADTSLPWVLQPFGSHTLPLLSAHVSLQPPLLPPCTLDSHPCTLHPGCDYTSLVTLATVHQAARSGDLQGHPESPSTHISAFSSLRSPCLAKGAHFYSQDIAVAPSHTGTGTSLVTVIISFLI